MAEAESVSLATRSSARMRLFHVSGTRQSRWCFSRTSDTPLLCLSTGRRVPVRCASHRRLRSGGTNERLRTAGELFAAPSDISDGASALSAAGVVPWTDGRRSTPRCEPKPAPDGLPTAPRRSPFN